ncbi:ABC transporter substrate-binding protein [Yinghuangia sp. YIM S09857]|uniref:bifunctional serine/threonine-protein kinase/ABC transporter substrate-binding protein n=1 Tax=Yinghuangia sp. YIM S09857 TaxID=3436929 RepID=UPI003F529CC7
MPPLQPDDPSQIADYRLLARLGSGGMGQVYLARSPGGRTVALKLVRPELTAEDGFRTRFRREVAAARRVSGAYTAPVVDADPDAEIPWLATAYVAGPSLTDAVAEHGPLPEPTVRALAAGLTEALRAVHGAGLVHRDLKPSNVLLALDGPRLIDFGISRAADDTSITSTGLVVGSPGYMSPEQANGGEVGPYSDFFSLASVLVFAATGLGPFGGGSAASLLYRIVHTPPDLEPVPAYLRPIVEPCLDKDPARRPNAGELLDLAVPDGQTTEVLTRSGWLPPAITYAIAERSAAVLDLDSGLGSDAGSGAGSGTAGSGGAGGAAGSAGAGGAGGTAGSGPAVPTGVAAPDNPGSGQGGSAPSQPAAAPPPPSYAPTVGPPAARLPFLSPSGQPYPPPALAVHEQPTPAGPFPPMAAGYGPPPVAYGTERPAAGHPVGPQPGGAHGSGGVNRRALVIGGAAVSVAAVGGLTAYLLTKSDGNKGDDDSADNVGNDPGGDQPVQGGDSPSPSGQRPLLKFGFQGGLTGENAQLGINMHNGATLAVNEANQRGDLPFRIELVPSDDQGSETKSAMAAQKLIDDDEVVAVVGPVFSGPTRAASALYENAGLSAVTPSATNPILTASPSTYFNRATTNDNEQGTEIAAYLKKLGAASVFLLGDGSSYAGGLLAAVEKGLGTAAKITKHEAPKGSVDYTDAANRVKASGAQALVYAGYYQDAAPFAVKLAAAGYTGHRIAPDGVTDPQFVRLAGPAAEDWFLTVPAVDPKAEPTLRAFATAYMQAFKTQPSTYSAEAYDVVNLIIEAAKSLRSQTPTRSAMLGAIRSVRYKTPLKEYAFDRSTGEFAGTGAVYGYQVKAQTITYVGNLHKLVTA